jgi:hypothetical protein
MRALALALLLALPACGSTIQVKYVDVEARQKLDEVIDFTNALEARIDTLHPKENTNGTGEAQP